MYNGVDVYLKPKFILKEGFARNMFGQVIIEEGQAMNILDSAGLNSRTPTRSREQLWGI